MVSTPATPLSTPPPAPLLATMAKRMSIVWTAAVLLTLVLGYGLNPVTEIMSMLQAQGVTDAQSQAAAFAAGFTLPVVVGAAALVILVGSGALAKMEGLPALILISLIFLATGVLSSIFGLGLAPDFAGTRMISGPPYVALPMFALQAYLSSYGLPLLLVGLALGSAAGLQVYRWLGMGNRQE